MDKKTLEKYWDEIKTKVKQQWARFSENELVKIKKSYEELKGDLEKKYAEKKEETQMKKEEKEENELKEKPEKPEENKKNDNDKD